MSSNIETREEKPRETGATGQKRRASPVWQRRKQVDGGWQEPCGSLGSRD